MTVRLTLPLTGMTDFIEHNEKVLFCVWLPPDTIVRGLNLQRTLTSLGTSNVPKTIPFYTKLSWGERCYIMRLPDPGDSIYPQQAWDALAPKREERSSITTLTSSFDELVDTATADYQAELTANTGDDRTTDDRVGSGSRLDLVELFGADDGEKRIKLWDMTRIFGFNDGAKHSVQNDSGSVMYQQYWTPYIEYPTRLRINKKVSDYSVLICAGSRDAPYWSEDMANWDTDKDASSNDDSRKFLKSPVDAQWTRMRYIREVIRHAFSMWAGFGADADETKLDERIAEVEQLLDPPPRGNALLANSASFDWTHQVFGSVTIDVPGDYVPPRSLDREMGS